MGYGVHGMKAAIVRIEQHQLLNLLQLPEGARITRARMDNDIVNGEIILRIEGAGRPTVEGLPLETIRPKITVTWNTKRGVVLNPEIDWDFTKDAKTPNNTKSAHDTASTSDSPKAVDALVSGKTG